MSFGSKCKTVRSVRLTTLVALFPVLLLGGCTDTDGPLEPGETPAPPSVPTLNAEPEFTAGTSNTIIWSAAAESVAAATTSDQQYQAESALDSTFADDTHTTNWITATSATFADLLDGARRFYRVRAKNAAGVVSPWSGVVSSTQDARAPASAVQPMADNQTALSFDVIVSTHETGSGVAAIELWYYLEQNPPLLYGTFATEVIRFDAPAAGRYIFYSVATDQVGNRQPLPEQLPIVTEVPERIIKVDLNGFEWDITHAALRYNMRPEYWRFGLGAGTIAPLIDPAHVSLDEHGVITPHDLTPVVGFAAEGEAVAYRIDQLDNYEVVDDMVGGTAIAATY